MVTPQEKLADEFAKWRRDPTHVIRCPTCDGLGGLHREGCALDPRARPIGFDGGEEVTYE